MEARHLPRSPRRPDLRPRSAKSQDLARAEPALAMLLQPRSSASRAARSALHLHLDTHVATSGRGMLIASHRTRRSRDPEDRRSPRVPISSRRRERPCLPVSASIRSCGSRASALKTYRVAHWCSAVSPARHGDVCRAARVDLRRREQSAARIGKGIMIDHAHGVVTARPGVAGRVVDAPWS